MANQLPLDPPMWFLKNTPIRSKLRFIMMVACSAALLIACVALFLFQLLIFRQTFERDLVALAEIISANSTAALTFKDDQAANEILSSLVAKPQIKGATILLPDGTALAQYGTGEKKRMHKTETPSFYVEGKELVFINPIIMDKKQIGTLGLYSDYDAEFAHLLELYVAILGVVLAVSILVAYLISARLQRMITQPILDLAETAGVIAENKDYSVRAQKIENDEVGLLTDAFNQMLSQIQVQDSELVRAREKLETQVKALSHQIAERKRAESKLSELHNQLIETSRQAGMAEVATGVLHNVGNILNSVNVSTTLISEASRRSKVRNLQKAVSLMTEQGDSVSEFLKTDPRGAVLPGYLEEISRHLIQEQENMQKEIDLLSKNIQHIKDIIALQQTHAKVGGIIEALSMESLVEDALQMNMIALDRHCIQVIRQYQATPLIPVDKHKVLQILINLIQNAKHALTERPGDCPRTLTVSIILKSPDRIQAVVADNGIGIPPENITRIFSHGFTTRKDGHGFGLHSGAITATEMGGSLTAFSNGPGLGSAFTLELPINHQPQ